MGDENGIFATLERWRARLFFAGAVALVITGGTFAAEALLDMRLTNHLATGPAWTIVFLGYLGLYRELAARHRWLARLAAILATVGPVGFIFVFVESVLDIAGVTTPAWVEILGLLALVGITMGPLVCGVTSLYTGAHARKVGLLLLGPSIVYYVNITRIVLQGGTTRPAVTTLILAAQVLVVSSISYQLRSSDAPANRVEPPANQTV